MMTAMCTCAEEVVCLVQQVEAVVQLMTVLVAVVAAAEAAKERNDYLSQNELHSARRDH